MPEREGEEERECDGREGGGLVDVDVDAAAFGLRDELCGNTERSTPSTYAVVALTSGQAWAKARLSVSVNGLT